MDLSNALGAGAGGQLLQPTQVSGGRGGALGDDAQPALAATGAGQSSTAGSLLSHWADDGIQAKSGVQPQTGDTSSASGGTYAQALARHKANLDKLSQLIKTGKTEAGTRFGTTWPNACQWLESGKTRLHALTKTHDSVERATHMGQPDKHAMFGIDVPCPSASVYDKDTKAKNQNNIYLADPSWVGFRAPGNPSKVVIIEPSTHSDDSVQETIVHEVQHDADHHAKTDDGGDAWGRYSTEFRAYWIDGTYRDRSGASGSAKSGLSVKDHEGKNEVKLDEFDNERQQTIFSKLYQSQSYAYVAKAWNDGSEGSEFQTRVLGMPQPQGINLVDSVRIDNLYLELAKSKPDRKRAIALADELNAEDKQAIAGEGMRSKWTSLIDSKFKGDDNLQLKQHIGL